MTAVAGELGRTASQVAIAWVRRQQAGAQIVPILGARTEEQVKDNLGVLEFELGPEHLARLEAAATFDLGFPRSFLESDHVRGLIFGETYDLIDAHR